MCIGSVVRGKDLGQQQIVIESDCLVLIQALKNNSRRNSNFHLVLEDIFDLCFYFSVVVWSFVKRSGNKVVHNLAHFQPWEIRQRLWEDEFQASILNVASADSLI